MEVVERLSKGYVVEPLNGKHMTYVNRNKVAYGSR